MTIFSENFLKASLVTLIVFFSYSFINAQDVNKSRIAVVTNETKTSIWISDFPTQTSVVIMDDEDNLLSIVTTNKFGAAFITLPKGITTEVIAKTISGNVSASNKAVIKKPREEENVATTDRDYSNKA